MNSIVSFVTGVSLKTWLIIGAVVAVLIFIGSVFQFGRNYQERIDDAAALRLTVQRQEAALAETARQQLAVNAIQANDATRAVMAEGDLRDLQRQLLETPVSGAACLGADAVERVRRFRVSPPNRPSAKRASNPG